MPSNPTAPDPTADSAYLASKQAQNDQQVAQAYLAANPDRAKAYGLETASTQPQGSMPNPDNPEADQLKERQAAQHATAEAAGEHVQNLETAIRALDPLAKIMTGVGAMGTGAGAMMEMGVPAANALLAAPALQKLQELGSEGARKLGQKIWGPDHPIADTLASLAGGAAAGGAALGGIPNAETPEAGGNLGEPPEGSNPAAPKGQELPNPAADLAQKQIEALKTARVGQTTAEEMGAPEAATTVPESLTLQEAQALKANVEHPSTATVEPPKMAAHVAALAQVYQEEAGSIRDTATDLLNRGAAGEDISAEQTQLEQRFAAYAVNYANLAGARSDVGRSLQILDPLKPGNLFAADTAKLAQEMAQDPDANLLQKLANLDPDRASTMARQMGEATAQGRSVSGMLREYYMNALLSKPSTFAMKKTAGDLTSYALAAPERWIAARMPSFGSAAPVASGEAEAFAQRSVAATADALRIAKLTFENGTSAVDALGGAQGSEFEPGMQLPQIRGDGSDDLTSHAMDLMGSVVRLPSRSIQAETDFWHVMNYRGQLGALAQRQATQDALDQGLQGGEAGQFIEQRAAELANDPPPDMVAASHAFAREQTFLKPFGPTGQAFNDFLNRLPAGLGRLLFPFRMVPVNIGKFVVGHTPMALATQSFYSDMQAGGAAGQLALAKLSTGTMITALGAKLYMDGHTTGGGPSDIKQYKDLVATGWQPYSIKVGDKYYSYDRLDPIGMMLGLPADYATLLGQQPDPTDIENPWPERINHAATALAVTLGRNSTRQSYVQTLVNVNSLIDSLKEGKTYEQGLSKFGAQEISGIIPAALRGEARREDPVARDTRGFMDTLLSNVPGFSQDMPPRRDLGGEPVTTPPGFFANEVYPFRIGAEKNDPVAREFYETGAQAQRVPTVLPGSGGGPGDPGVALDKYQQDRWQVLRASTKDPDSGATMMDALKSTMADPDYKDLANEDKAKTLERVVLAYGKAATQRLLQEDPNLQAQYAMRQKFKVLGHAPAGANPADFLRQAGLSP